MKRGSKIYVEGALRTRKWQDKESGQDRYTTEIVANEMQMLDSRGGQDRMSADQDNGTWNSQPPEASSRKTDTKGNANSGGGEGFQTFDDDIPF